MEIITDKDGLFSVAAERLLRHEPRLKHVATLDLEEFVLPEVTEPDGKRFRTYFDVGKVCRGWVKGAVVSSLNISNTPFSDPGERASVEHNLPPSRGKRSDFPSNGGKGESKWSLGDKEADDLDAQFADLVSNVDLREHLRCTTEVQLEVARKVMLTRGKSTYLAHAVLQISKGQSGHILDQEYTITLRVSARHYVTRKPLGHLRPHPLPELLAELALLDEKLPPWAGNGEKGLYKLTEEKHTHRKWYQVLLDKIRKDRSGDEGSKRNTTLSDTEGEEAPSKEKASPEHEGEKDSPPPTAEEPQPPSEAQQEGSEEQDAAGSEEQERAGTGDLEEEIMKVLVMSDTVESEKPDDPDRKAFFSERSVTTTTMTSGSGVDEEGADPVTVATTSSSSSSTETRKVTTTTTTTTSHVHFQDGGDGLETEGYTVEKHHGDGPPEEGEEGSRVVYKQETVTTVMTSSTEGGDDMSPVQVIIEESPPQDGEAEFPPVTMDTTDDGDAIVTTPE